MLFTSFLFAAWILYNTHAVGIARHMVCTCVCRFDPYSRDYSVNTERPPITGGFLFTKNQTVGYTIIKKLKSDGIYCLGQASGDAVTGSSYLVKFGNSRILLECGLYQSSTNSYIDAYKVNSRPFEYKPKTINAVVVGHPHIDHAGLLPRLVAEGYSSPIYATSKTISLLKPLLMNSQAILENEAKLLSKKYKRVYKPLYTIEDVKKTLDLMVSCDDAYNDAISIAENISLKLLHNSHTIGSVQVELICRDELRTKKILYTSDIGGFKTDNHFVDGLEPANGYYDFVIGESTYGHRADSGRKRKTDLDLMKTVINESVEQGGSVLFSAFSFQRTQELLVSLWEIYGSDHNFNIPVVVDSTLSVEICKLYTKLLEGNDLVTWQNVISWRNLRLITDKNKSDLCMADTLTPKIVISSSGFMTAGRSVKWCKTLLDDSNNAIFLSGYVGSSREFLSYRLKNASPHERVKINGVYVSCEASIHQLLTFSSHMSHHDLVEYYGGKYFDCEKLILCHGRDSAKIALKSDIDVNKEKNNRTYKVLVGNVGMLVRF